MLFRIDAKKRESPKREMLKVDSLVDSAISLGFGETHRHGYHQCRKACKIEQNTKVKLREDKKACVKNNATEVVKKREGNRKPGALTPAQAQEALADDAVAQATSYGHVGLPSFCQHPAEGGEEKEVQESSDESTHHLCEPRGSEG